MQMRLPSLLFAHTCLLGMDVALQRICGRSGMATLVQVVALRVCACSVALGLDMARRSRFMRHQGLAVGSTAAQGTT
jgi:hypothetical protein